MLVTELENCSNFNKNLPKKFHKFKLIEILNEHTIKEHFTFVHTFYGKGKYQRIYIADNMQYILERLVN
jgi:hypothetical protein